jgi:hypothetical protein
MQAYNMYINLNPVYHYIGNSSIIVYPYSSQIPGNQQRFFNQDQQPATECICALK